MKCFCTSNVLAKFCASGFASTIVIKGCVIVFDDHFLLLLLTITYFTATSQGKDWTHTAHAGVSYLMASHIMTVSLVIRVTLENPKIGMIHVLHSSYQFYVSYVLIISTI